MGKIRIKTIGDEKVEKEQKAKAKQRAEVKKVEKSEVTAEAKKTEAAEEIKKAEVTEVKIDQAVEVKSEKAIKKKSAKSSDTAKRSQKYLAVAQLIDKNKSYPLTEALNLLPKLKIAKFDETVELHINTTDTGISGSVVLPNGTGKKTRIVIVNQSEDPKAVEELVKKVEAGNIDFDVLIATPDSMPKLAKIARFLGPKGLMPNPKNGTVTPKPEAIAKKYEGGQVNFKTEAKAPLLHLSVGKLSFGEKKLEENIKAAIEAVQAKNVKRATLKSTMSPGIKLDINTL